MGFVPTQSMSLCQANLQLKCPLPAERLRHREKERSRSINIVGSIRPPDNYNTRRRRVKSAHF